MSEASPAPTAPSPEERGARARELAGMLTRRALIIGACAVLIPIAVFILVELQPKQYRAAVIIQPAPLIPSDVVVSSQVPSGWFVSPDASFVALLAKTSPVRIEAARQLDRPAAQLGSLSATVQKKTGWVTITATGGSSRAAVNATNAVAAAIGQNLRLRTRKALAVLTSSLQYQLAHERDPGVRGQIRAQLAAFRSFRPQDAQPIQVIAPAVGASPVSNRPWLAGGFALLIALFVGWRLARLAERADDSVHEPEEVERVVGAPLLTAVQDSGNARPEPYLRLRDSLVHLAGQGRRATLVVTSPRQGEGRTSVAIGLAKAYTASGQTVVLVDADLRDPQVATRMVIAPQPGLADALTGASIPEALHVGLHPNLTVLPAGVPRSEAADLIGSERMTALLEDLARRFDIVIVDTPPLLAASDALALANAASGVLLVVRIDHTSRRALQRATQILTRAGATILGPVVTGVRADRQRLPSPLSAPAEQGVVAHASGG